PRPPTPPPFPYTTLFRSLGVLLRALEHRRLLHATADPEADGEQGRREQEGDPPAPGLEAPRRDGQPEHRDHRGGEHRAGRRARLRPGRPEPTAARLAVLAHQQDRKSVVSGISTDVYAYHNLYQH